MKDTKFPKYLNTNSTERIGVNAVAQIIAHLGLIWRETSTADVGIDGQIEYVDIDGNATGEIVAVQIKSGVSFFKNEKENSFIFYPEEKHMFYWERFPLPVILILHNPDTNLSYWIDIRQVLRSPDRTSKAILIPKENILEHIKRDTLFHTLAIQDCGILSIDNLLDTLVHRKIKINSFEISFLDLFAFGITNLARSLYFGGDLVYNIIESNSTSDFNMPKGDILLEYINFLINQNIANVDYSDVMIDWFERKLIPTFIVPLTSRGLALTKLISELESKYQEEGLLEEDNSSHVIQEANVTLDFCQYTLQRLPIINKFTAIYEEKS